MNSVYIVPLLTKCCFFLCFCFMVISITSGQSLGIDFGHYVGDGTMEVEYNLVPLAKLYHLRFGQFISGATMQASFRVGELPTKEWAVRVEPIEYRVDDIFPGGGEAVYEEPTDNLMEVKITIRDRKTNEILVQFQNSISEWTCSPHIITLSETDQTGERYLKHNLQKLLFSAGEDVQIFRSKPDQEFIFEFNIVKPDKANFLFQLELVSDSGY